MDIKSYKEKVDLFNKNLKEVDPQKVKIKLSEDKWSLSEIIGHLIDSASNNHQRFVRLQFGDLLDFPAYDTEPWVKIQSYNTADWETLVTLWYNYNVFLLNVIQNIDETNYKNIWVKDENETYTLEEIIIGYYKHLDIHIEQFSNRLKELV
jgi:hypothetical protein